jgi:putative glutamine amidotransferase
MLKIGISACFFHPDPQRAVFKGKTLQYVEQQMTHWVMQKDALALMIPSPDGESRHSQSLVIAADYARELDGLVLMGGSDVAPQSYGETPLKPAWAGDKIRDDYEIDLYRAFVAAGKPVLGICRGAQVINVAQGGTLYQDIATQVPGALNHRDWDIYDRNCHATALVPESGLGRLYPGVALTKTNSVHHQAVKALGRELAVEAWSEPDRVIEAIRWRGPSYVFAVQWHPEFHDREDGSFIDDTPILEEFLARAGRIDA